MAGFTHGLCMSLHSVWVVLFSAVTYGNSTVDCSEGPLPVTICRVCSVGVTGPAVWWWGDWCLLIAVLLQDNNQILVFLMGQKAHPSVWVYLYDHLQIGRPSYSLTPNRPEALLGWCKAQRNRLCTQEFSLNCSSYPASVPWYWLVLPDAAKVLVQREPS